MANRVFSFHYTLTNRQGEKLDSSIGQDPFKVMEGVNQIIPGLEKELVGMAAGEKRVIEVSSDEAYGPVMEELRITVKRSQLPEGQVEQGMRFSTGKPENPVFTVIKVEEEDVHLDGNHPLAGVDLTFDVEMIEIREATADEIEHGHAHGPHGHEH